MYNLINKTNTVYDDDCFLFFSLIPLAADSEGGEVTRGAGSEARMKGKDEKRQFPLRHSEAATISQTGRGGQKGRRLFLVCHFSQSTKEPHSAHFHKILNPFLCHIQSVYFQSLWGL